MFGINWHALCQSESGNFCMYIMKAARRDLFRMYILFSRYKSCDNTQGDWSFVLLIKKSACTILNREFKKWRRQRPRQYHKLMIWLIEWGKIIVLHVRHDFWCNFWCSLPKDDVTFSYLRFWRQRESAAINFSFSALTWKAFVPKKQKVHCACFV